MISPLSTREFNEIEKEMEKVANSIAVAGGLSEEFGGFCDTEIVYPEKSKVFFRVRYGVSNQYEREISTMLFVVDRKTFFSSSVLGPVAVTKGSKQFSA